MSTSNMMYSDLSHERGHTTRDHHLLSARGRQGLPRDCSPPGPEKRRWDHFQALIYIMTVTRSYSPGDSASNYTITYEEYYTLASTWSGTRTTN